MANPRPGHARSRFRVEPVRFVRRIGGPRRRLDRPGQGGHSHVRLPDEVAHRSAPDATRMLQGLPAHLVVRRYAPAGAGPRRARPTGTARRGRRLEQGGTEVRRWLR